MKVYNQLKHSQSSDYRPSFTVRSATTLLLVSAVVPHNKVKFQKLNLNCSPPLWSIKVLEAETPLNYVYTSLDTARLSCYFQLKVYVNVSRQVFRCLYFKTLAVTHSYVRFYNNFQLLCTKRMATECESQIKPVGTLTNVMTQL